MTHTSLICRLTLACSAVFTAHYCQADLLATIKARGEIRIAIAGGVPPFNVHDAQGKLIGSDVDTARALAQDMGVRLTLVSINNSERVDALTQKRSDLVISALSITPERERQIAFSVPYATIGVVIAAPASYTLSSMLDLNGKTVGALAASSNLAHLIHNAPSAKILQYPENDRMSEAFLAGEFDIMSAPASVVEKTNAMKPRQHLKIQFTQMEFNVAVGLPKSEKNLREWINAWVVSKLENRQLDEIYRKHHGKGLPASIIPQQLPPKKALP